ncbi:MAG TPA: histidine phosphatase family protein [Streptosporangiaceae bacterium]|nr:histidine phosphatase family protein [Streptosporangiaceae bacterium]
MATAQDRHTHGAGKRLIVMRHAKAGELPGGPDFERALRPRGRKNAESAGEWLASQGFIPDLVLCSKARRARQTWQYVSAGLSGKSAVVTDERLYGASADDLLRIFANTEPGVGTLMYVGHNPAAAEVAEIVTGAPIEFPTSAIAVIDLGIGWPELPGGAHGAGDLVVSWTPHAQA